MRGNQPQSIEVGEEKVQKSIEVLIRKLVKEKGEFAI
jgi:hypothetical protein